MDEVVKTPVLELASVVFDLRESRAPIDLSLSAGELAWMPGFSRALPLLGIHPPARGEIRFQGKSWADRSIADTEVNLRRIGCVVNPHSHPAKIWIGNLDVDENVHLVSQFDPARTSDEISERAAALAAAFGLSEGLPTTRPADTDPADLILAQWVRAFLPRPLDLLILEDPTDLATYVNVAALVRHIEEARAAGTAVVWIAESIPPFSNLGLRADFVLE